MRMSHFPGYLGISIAACRRNAEAGHRRVVEGGRVGRGQGATGRARNTMLGLRVFLGSTGSDMSFDNFKVGYDSEGDQVEA